MALRYVLDEHLRGPLWRSAQRHNERGVHPIDVVRVGDLPELALEVDDPALLRWAEEADRILVTRDQRTMPAHLERHLSAGRRRPGIFMVRPGGSVAEPLSFLVLAAHASEPEEWRDRIEYIPPGPA